MGVLEVVVVQGLGLPAGDRNGLSDPYAKLCLTVRLHGMLRHWQPGQSPTYPVAFLVVRAYQGVTSAGQEWCAELRTGRETSKRYSTLSPVWNEQLFFKVPRAGGVLRLQVYDWDLAASDDLLGSAEVPLSSLLHGKRVEQWLELRGEDGEPKGQVQVVMQYTFNRWVWQAESRADRSAPSCPSTAHLWVVVLKSPRWHHCWRITTLLHRVRACSPGHLCLPVPTRS